MNLDPSQVCPKETHWFQEQTKAGEAPCYPLDLNKIGGGAVLGEILLLMHLFKRKVEENSPSMMTMMMKINWVIHTFSEDTNIP